MVPYFVLLNNANVDVVCFEGRYDRKDYGALISKFLSDGTCKLAKMKIITLVECIVLVAAVHAATFTVPIVSVARDALDSLSRERMAAMIEAGRLRAGKQNQNVDRLQRLHRKERPLRSGPVGGIENDKKYMDYIKESSMMKAEESEPDNSRTPLPLWVSTNFQS